MSSSAGRGSSIAGVSKRSSKSDGDRRRQLDRAHALFELTCTGGDQGGRSGVVEDVSNLCLAVAGVDGDMDRAHVIMSKQRDDELQGGVQKDGDTVTSLNAERA